MATNPARRSFLNAGLVDSLALLRSACHLPHKLVIGSWHADESARASIPLKKNGNPIAATIQNLSDRAVAQPVPAL